MKPSTKTAQSNGHAHRRFAAGMVATALLGLPGVAGAHDLHLDPAATVDLQTDAAEPEDSSNTWSDLVRDLPDDIYSLIASALVGPADAIGNATITERGNYRYIRSNGLPNHATGRFPNSGNPNAISAQSYNFRVPLNPRKKSSATEAGRYLTGVAVNGVPIDPGTAEYFGGRGSPWREEAITASGQGKLGLDSSNAHVQPNGAYHYHGVPRGLIATLGGSKLIGYAADGFPIYYTGQKSSYRLKSGSRPSGAGSPGGTYDGTYGADYAYVGGTLDQCNGTTSKTAEYPDGTYHYVVTTNYPFFPRCFMGTPDSSFRVARAPTRRGAAQQGQRPGPRQGGPRPLRRPPPRT